MDLGFIDISIAIFFIVWFFASIFSQFDKPIILNYDPLYILPVCRFFSPKPISKDIMIYVQGTDDNGKNTHWKQLYFPKRAWWNFIWNPQHRVSKTIIALYQQMKPFEDDKHLIHLSTPYLTILNTSTSIYSNDKKVTNIQFMITKYSGYEDEVRDIVFLSNVHKV